MIWPYINETERIFHLQERIASVSRNQLCTSNCCGVTTGGKKKSIKWKVSMSSSERYHWKFKLEALQPPLFRLSTTHDSLSQLSTHQILHRHTEISACPRNVKFRPFLFEARDRNWWFIRPRKKGKIKISTFFFFLRVTGGLKRGHSLEELPMIRTCLVF